MGLTICKKISERMGGQVKVKSKVGEGSTFTFSVMIDNFINNYSNENLTTMEHDDVSALTETKNFVFRNAFDKGPLLF